jgi:rSAM/selenodomain-associated transferase 2
MHSTRNTYELSVIIPTLNEAAIIGELLRNLACQQGVDFEVILSDGGSSDGTVENSRALSDELSFPLLVMSGEKGRGRQMNAAARVARGEHFLFLHADSMFPDVNAFRAGLDMLRRYLEQDGRHQVAGRFALRFLRRDTEPSFFYHYCECKARLDREGCTHGDQGFLLSRAFFADAGPFDESCAVMEDTRFAETVRVMGRWILFKPQILTSARRFESEGETQRQLLNVIIMTLGFVGRDDIIRELPGIYSERKNPGRLRIGPFLERISFRLKCMTFRERAAFWSDTGRYVCRNAWQLAFALDTRGSFRKGISAGAGTYRLLGVFDRVLARPVNSAPMTLAASCVVWLLFRCALPMSRIIGPRHK